MKREKKCSQFAKNVKYKIKANVSSEIVGVFRNLRVGNMNVRIYASFVQDLFCDNAKCENVLYFARRCDKLNVKL